MKKEFWYHDKLILKRNNESERELNYKKIYDLSKIDKIPGINPEKKFELLLSIKKILLCTNKYIDICNAKELSHYIIVSFAIFLVYITILSPFYEIIILSEERIKRIGNYTFKNKLWYYMLGQMLEIIFRIFFNYLRHRKTRKIMTYYAENELNKIRNEFNIDIDENNFDLYINYKKAKFRYISDSYEKDFQYVICYPNVRYYDWDENILNENEKNISKIIKVNIKHSEDEFIIKNFIHSIVILLLYLAFFFFLTVKNLKIFFSLIFIFFAYTKIVSYFLSNEFKKILIEKEKNLNFIFIDKGYLIILSSAVIHIFKLNPIEYYKGKNFNEIYMSFFEKVVQLNNKYSFFSFLN